MVGLLPLDKPDGAPALAKLAEAQGLRAIAERVLAELTHQPIVGHDELVGALGNGYIVNWFRCAGQLPCITTLFEPVRSKGGYRTAVTGDYAPTDTGFHVRMLTFSLEGGKIAKQIEFDLPAAAATDPSAWRAKLATLLESNTGTIKLVTNVTGTTCTIDGATCALGEDGATITASAGRHTLALAKDGYRTATVLVAVQQGGAQEMDVALQVAGGGLGSMKLSAARTDKAPNIDGHLDDPVWQKAWVETSFTQHYPDENTAPTEPTELRVLYDDDSLYIGIRCYDSQPDKIVSRLTRRDRDIESDRVQVDISSKNDHATAYHFQVNAANVQVDGMYARPTNGRFHLSNRHLVSTEYTSDLDLIWFSATSRDALGWTAELRIPLVALRYTGDVSSFGFQVRRILQRRQEIDEWEYIPRSAKSEVAEYGTLEGLHDLHPARLFQLAPYDSRRLTFLRNRGGLDGNYTGGNVGADLKVGVTPALTLDATLSPDFGTVEVDEVVLNLTNTETQFPEKRPFFLEGADIFTTPLQLFYSRRIGREPPVSEIGSNVTPQPQGQIYGAAKLTGVLTGRLSIGVIEAVTARQDTTINRGDGGPNETDLADPLSNFAIVRLRQEFAANSSVGVLATAVNRSEPANAATPVHGDLCPVPYGDLAPALPGKDGRCTSDAYTGGVDSVLRTADGRWGISAQGVASVLEHGPARYIPDGTTLLPGQLGWGMTAEAGKFGGEHWLADLRYQGASPTLDINDAGYIQMSNYRDFFGSVTWRELKPHGPLRDMSYQLYGGTNRTWDFAGKTRTRVGFSSSFDFQNFWNVNFAIVPYVARFDLYRETHSDALAEYPHTFSYSIDVKTDTRRKVILDVDTSVRGALRGLESNTDVTLNLRPIPTLELDLISSFYSATGAPRWLETTFNPNGSRTFYFADLSTQVFSTTLRGTYTFTPNLSLQMYTQLFADRGHYGRITGMTASGYRPVLPVDHFVDLRTPGDFSNPDFQDGTVNVNLFLRWEYLPGSALWLVYTRNQNQPSYDATSLPALRFDPFAPGPSTDVVLVKLSYMWEPFRRSR